MRVAPTATTRALLLPWFVERQGAEALVFQHRRPVHCTEASADVVSQPGVKQGIRRRPPASGRSARSSEQEEAVTRRANRRPKMKHYGMIMTIASTVVLMTTAASANDVDIRCNHDPLDILASRIRLEW